MLSYIWTVCFIALLWCNNEAMSWMKKHEVQIQSRTRPATSTSFLTESGHPNTVRMESPLTFLSPCSSSRVSQMERIPAGRCPRAWIVHTKRTKTAKCPQFGHLLSDLSVWTRLKNAKWQRLNFATGKSQKWNFPGGSCTGAVILLHPSDSARLLTPCPLQLLSMSPLFPWNWLFSTEEHSHAAKNKILKPSFST